MLDDFKKVNFDFEALDSCPLCCAKAFVPNGRINWLGIDFWYVVCAQCGVKFMNPRPTLESYRDFYKNLFWQQKIRNIGFRQPGQAWQAGKYKWDDEKKWDPEFGRKNLIEKTKTLRFETIADALNGHLNLDPNVDILEVGSGYPVVLESIKETFGCRVYAIEPSEDVWDITKKNDSPVKFIGRYAEDLNELSRKGQKFDAIIFSHVLENTVDPLAVIGYAKKCLKKNGLIYVQTPNLLVNDQMNPYHPYIFCSNALLLIAKKTGLNYKRISKTIDRMLTAVFLNKK